MAHDIITSRAVIGRFYAELEAARQQTWNGRIAARIDSDQETETVAFLGQAPRLREWIGGRQVQALAEKSIRIPNRHWESTIEFFTRDMRRDKSGQINARILELAQAAATHPQALISDLINAGESSLCYDGQYFFDSDHAEGTSGTQGNIVECDISATGVPLAQQGTTTAPSAWTLAEAIVAGVVNFLTLKDDRGEPIHQEGAEFLVQVPRGFFPAMNGLGANEFAFGVPNVLQRIAENFRIEVMHNARLTFTDRFPIFRTNGPTRPFLHSVETEVQMKAKGEGSEFEFDMDQQQFGVDQWSNVEYGWWQTACLVKLV